jgi:hypothetical protein
MCSRDNKTWQACEKILPTQYEIIYLKDDPSLPEHSLPSGGASSIISRIWKINGKVFNSDNNPNPSLKIPATSNTVELIITDDRGRSAFKVHQISAKPLVPRWFPQ